MTNRQVKERVALALALGRGDPSPLDELPPDKLTKTLLKFICRPEPGIRWPAVEAMGRAAARLAPVDENAVREVIRRLIWSLNDDSGAIGWGAAEALGEILAEVGGDIADDFGPILIAQLAFDPGSPDFEPLLAGAVWGVARLVDAHPDFGPYLRPHLARLLTAGSPLVRGSAVRLAGAIGSPGLRPLLEPLTGDSAELPLWTGDRLIQTTVGRLAQEALNRLSPA